MDGTRIFGKEIMAAVATLSFSHEKWSLRARVAAGKVWFLGSDVARALGYQYPHMAVESRVPIRWRQPYKALVSHCEGLFRDRHDKSRESWITELGLYALCRDDDADFREWIQGEVLPECWDVLPATTSA
jgi:prophage antirepressor-like protein